MHFRLGVVGWTFPVLDQVPGQLLQQSVQCISDESVLYHRLWIARILDMFSECV